MSVGVVIPTFRRARYLEAALLSVRNQSFADFECIVVNDDRAGHGEVERLIARLGDQRFRLVEGSGTGANAARNAGIRQASRPLIAFLDDDDCWFPEKLAKHVAAHGEYAAGVVHSGVIYFDDLTGYVREAPARSMQGGARDALLAGKCPPTCSCTSVEREAILAVGGFDEALVSFQDWDLWLRMSERTSFHAISEPLAVFRQHQGTRTSTDPSRRSRGLEQVVSKFRGTYELSGFVAAQKGPRGARAHLSHLLRATLGARGHAFLAKRVRRRDQATFGALSGALAGATLPSADR